MSEFLIKSYVSRLTLGDIDSFARSHGILFSHDELELIKSFVKKDWHTIIYGNPRPILDSLRDKLDSFKYNKIENLYVEFKNKYSNYL